MIAIQLDALAKIYPGTIEPAVNNISLEIEKGSIVTLLGPSGCGKTTILRLIAGFEKAERGTVSLDGKVVAGNGIWVPPEQRGVGMVFQDYALFPHLDVYKNVGFGYKGEDRRERIMQVLDLVGLQGLERRYPHELSGGQQQRVALARALARRPVVVLLDEPFSNLDADMRAQMRLEVKRIIKNAGATAVLVSHDQKDALAISDKIAVLEAGEIQQVGTPREIYQYPENSFVATFVGQTNLLKGKIGEDGCSVLTALGKIPYNYTHAYQPGEQVNISVRAESLEMSREGNIKGRVKEAMYTGEAIDVQVVVDLPGGESLDLVAHVHPEEEVREGDMVAFSVLPNFVKVVGDK